MASLLKHHTLQAFVCRPMFVNQVEKGNMTLTTVAGLSLRATCVCVLCINIYVAN